MLFNAFIARPFGVKNDVDFDKVDAELIQPALRQTGIIGSTTASIFEAGNIREDMFGRLLTADIVIADVSIHNANVFYELGIRHALRDKHTFLIRCNKDEIPFDLKTDRYLSYDAENPAECLPNLIRGLTDTLQDNRKDSPVFYMLPNLEPQNAEAFLAVPPDFDEELEVASTSKQEGKLALLAAEVEYFEWEVPALRLVGEVQFNIKSYDVARLTWEKIRNYKPDDLDANDRLATIYQRLSEDVIRRHYDEGIELIAQSDACVHRILQNYHQLDDNKRAEVYALKARNYKSRWANAWKRGNKANDMADALESAYLYQCYDSYEQAYNEDLNHYYSGLNALATLSIILSLITQQPDVWEAMWESKEEADARVKQYEERHAQLLVLVKAALAAQEKRTANEDTRDPWLSMSEADYALLVTSNPKRVENLYRQIIQTASDFDFEASHNQLLLYKSLNVLPLNTDAALKAFENIHYTHKSNKRYLLFTGHMIDQPDRKEPRFPQAREAEIRDKIKAAVQQQLTDNNDDKDKITGIAGGACGSDILFHEVCRELGIKTHLYLAVPAEQFVVESVAFAGADWTERFYNLYHTLDRHVLSQSMDLPNWLQKKQGYTIWERNNLWMLYSSLVCGGSNTSLIAVWNGKGGDGPGGTQHMIDEAKSRGAEIDVIAI